MEVSNYRVIYNSRVFKVLEIMPTFRDVETTETNSGLIVNKNNIEKSEYIQTTVINEYGEILMLSDEAHMFQFIKEID